MKEKLPIGTKVSILIAGDKIHGVVLKVKHYCGGFEYLVGTSYGSSYWPREDLQVRT